MKVICIDNTRGNARHLDLEKVYDVEIVQRHNQEYYVIQSTVYSNPTHRIGILPERDVWIGVEKWTTFKCLIPLEEYRSRKLEKLGI